MHKWDFIVVTEVNGSYYFIPLKNIAPSISIPVTVNSHSVLTYGWYLLGNDSSSLPFSATVRKRGAPVSMPSRCSHQCKLNCCGPLPIIKWVEFLLKSTSYFTSTHIPPPSPLFHCPLPPPESFNQFLSAPHCIPLDFAPSPANNGPTYARLELIFSHLHLFILHPLLSV